jgi:hypothetical protein
MRARVRGVPVYYYNDGENEVGPFTLERLRILSESGLIGSGTLVRRIGETSWVPFAMMHGAAEARTGLAAAAGDGRFDGAGARLPAPDAGAARMGPWRAIPAAPGGAEQDQPTPLPARTPSGWLAEPPTPWRRYGARVLDTTVNGFLGLSLLGVISYSVAPATADRLFSLFESEAGVLIDLLLSGLVASLIGGSLIGVSGFTLGKLIFGIMVTRPDGARLGVAAGVARDLSVLVKGLGLGIPVVVLFTMLLSYRTLLREGSTSWDRGAFVVWHRPSGAAQYVLNVAGILLMVLAAVFVRALAEL